MDGSRFDQLARDIAIAGSSRRQVLRRWGAATIGGVVGLLSQRGELSAQDAARPAAASPSSAGAPAATTAFTRMDRQTGATYAPYWYLDDDTDSLIEIKNMLDEVLRLRPVVSLSAGPTIDLDEVTIPPHATSRLSLKVSLASQRQLVPGDDLANQRWGDGSRPRSLLGSAKLLPTSPSGATAGAFAAWIVVVNLKEGLGFPTTFESPGKALTTGLEGLWWLPFPDTQAYFALRNTSEQAITVSMTLLGEGHTLSQREVSLAASAMALVNVREELGAAVAPSVGGVRFSYGSVVSQVLPGDLVARGMFIQEEVGFSSTLMMAEALDPLTADVEAELQVAGVYFGTLDRMVAGTTLFMHPHLLVRNISARDTTIQATVYGRDGEGQPASFDIAPIALKPESPVVIDLEEERRATRSGLTEGVAGLRVRHDGGPTDVVVQLINVDETGNVTWYDRFWNRFLDEGSAEVAISFNLEYENRSFIIVKNVTDDPQQVRVLLNYADDGGAYEVVLPEIPEQQVEVVDIKRLRDERTSDRNGRLLPADVALGGAIILGTPGTFVSSDPTFMLNVGTGPSVIATEDGFIVIISCMAIFHGAPGGGGPGGGGNPCNRVKYCGIQGIPCAFCGGSDTSCPSGCAQGASWTVCCGGRLYTYRDCCGSCSCSATFCPNNPGTPNWCGGAGAYRCTLAIPGATC